MNLLETRMAVLNMLDSHAIPYEYYEHKRAHTIEDCLRMPMITDDVTICKNILLCNRQQTAYYLLLLKPLTPFRTAVISKLLSSSRLSFAPENVLEEKLRLTSGSVSPLGLLFDTEKQITLCYDKTICDTPKIAFHPCDNAATLVFEQQAFWEQVIPAIGIIPVRLDLPKTIDETQGIVVK